MDPRKFFYVCAGMLALSIAYQVGVERARADWSGVGMVIACDGTRAWSASGESWIATSGQWYRDSEIRDLPAFAGQVKMFSASGGDCMLVTDEDVVWHLGGASGWERMPPLPAGTVANRSKSFGQTKATFR